MCVVSMISDHWRDKWPAPIVPINPAKPYEPLPSWPYIPSQPTVPMDVPDSFPTQPPFFRMITNEEWNEYQALKRKAVEYDVRTKQPDCVKPEVADWEEDIEVFLILMGLITE